MHDLIAGSTRFPTVCSMVRETVCVCSGAFSSISQQCIAGHPQSITYTASHLQADQILSRPEAIAGHAFEMCQFCQVVDLFSNLISQEGCGQNQMLEPFGQARRHVMCAPGLSITWPGRPNGSSQLPATWQTPISWMCAPYDE